MIHVNGLPTPRREALSAALGDQQDALFRCQEEFKQILVDLAQLRESQVASRELSLTITEGEVLLMWLEKAYHAS